MDTLIGGIDQFLYESDNETRFMGCLSLVLMCSLYCVV